MDKKKNMIGYYTHHMVCVPYEYFMASSEKRPNYYFKLLREYLPHYYHVYRAWEALEDDLEFLGLPGRYKSYVSMMRGRLHWYRSREKHPNPALK